MTVQTAFPALAARPQQATLTRMFRLISALTLLLFPLSLFAAVENFKVSTSRSVDTTSLESIVRDVFAHSGAKTNDEKAIAIYDWLHEAIFHKACPTEKKPESVGPLKSLNVYGWGLCGSQHTVLKALYETAGWECRYVGWSDPGHSTIEVKYDGQWHYLDVFLKCYFWSKDKSHLVSQEEIAADPSLVMDAAKEGRVPRSYLCCGDTPEGIISGIQSRKVIGDSKGWANVTWRDEKYSPVLRLPCGSALRLEWKAEENGYVVSGGAPKHSCGDKDYRRDPVLGPVFEHYGPRAWANGRFTYTPDFSQAADTANITLTNAKASAGKLTATAGKAAAVFRLPLPCAWVSAEVQAAFDGEGTLAISTDGGKSWQPCTAGDITTQVKQKYDVCLRAEFAGALKSLSLTALVEHNRGILPYLMPGTNKVTASTGGNLPPGAVATVTFAWQEATAPAKRPQWNGHGLTYSAEKFLTKELNSTPVTFDITAGGNTPPKMLYIERAVRSKAAPH